MLSRGRSAMGNYYRATFRGFCLSALLFALTSGLSLVPARAGSLEAAIAALKKDGRVILMRHTQTVPGVGDPDGFKLEECATQRNLNDEGIDQARRFGAVLKAAGIRIGRVLVSEWCRADDTARYILEAAGQSDLPRTRFWPLNNVWDDDSRVDEQTTKTRAEIASWQGPGTLLMVSHGVTIRPVTGQSTSQGGFFVIEPMDNTFKIVIEGRL